MYFSKDHDLFLNYINQTFSTSYIYMIQDSKIPIVMVKETITLPKHLQQCIYMHTVTLSITSILVRMSRLHLINLVIAVPLRNLGLKMV